MCVRVCVCVCEAKNCKMRDSRFQSMNAVKSLSVRKVGEALAKFLPIARFGHYEFNGRGPML